MLLFSDVTIHSLALMECSINGILIACDAAEKADCVTRK